MRRRQERCHRLLYVLSWSFLANQFLNTSSRIRDKLKRTEAAIENYRNHIDTRKAENYGFASMAAVPYAHIVAHLLRSKHPKGTTIDLAPNPRDIVRSSSSSTRLLLTPR